MRLVPFFCVLLACTPAPQDSADPGLADAVVPTNGGSGPTGGNPAGNGQDADDDVDSDGDGYSDADELHAGTDPDDPDSVIYECGWPYNANKDALDDPGFTGTPLTIGATMPRHVGMDHCGDQLDLYDFAGQGKLTVLDSSTGWCTPCKDIADWLAHGEQASASLEADFQPLREAVERGDIQWVTLLVDGVVGGTVASLDELQDWESSYPHERIPVVNDPDDEVTPVLNSMEGGGYSFPRFALVDENMEAVETGSYLEFLAAANEWALALAE